MEFSSPRVHVLGCTDPQIKGPRSGDLGTEEGLGRSTGVIDFGALVAAVNADPEFSLCARYWDSRLRIVIDDSAVELLIVDGRVLVVGAPGEFRTDLHRITLSASSETWAKVLAPHPPPGWQDIGWAPGFSLEGNVLDRAPYYPALRRLVAL